MPYCRVGGNRYFIQNQIVKPVCPYAAIYYNQIQIRIECVLYSIGISYAHISSRAWIACVAHTIMSTKPNSQWPIVSADGLRWVCVYMFKVWKVCVHLYIAGMGNGEPGVVCGWWLVAVPQTAYVTVSSSVSLSAVPVRLRLQQSTCTTFHTLLCHKHEKLLWIHIDYTPLCVM